MLVGRYNRSHRTNAPSEPILINESDCSRDFSKEMTKKYRDTHKKIRNCNEFDNSLNFAKVSGHVLMESRDGLVADVSVSAATGMAKTIWYVSEA